MKYNSTFFIQVYIDGYQAPLMHVESSLLEQFKELSHLGRGHLEKSEGVRQELDGIEEVLRGEKEVHTFAGDDWCIVDFKKDKSIITNGFDEFEPFEVDSNDIVNLLRDWYNFLKTYESGNIPGVTPPVKK